MKHHIKYYFVIGAIFFTPSKAWTHDHNSNKFSLGLKYGALFVDEPKADSTNPLGIQLEYHFNQKLAIEIDYIKGDSGTDDSLSDENMASIGIYGVLRSQNSTYALLKLGIQNELGKSELLNQKGINLSAGIGAGVNLNRQFAIESEYTLLNENLSYLGISLRFGF